MKIKVNKKLVLRGYAIKGSDSRSGKPFSDTIALDMDIIRTGEMAGMDTTSFIEHLYRQKGYRVSEITRGHTVNAVIDLVDLYRPELADQSGVYIHDNADYVEDKILDQAINTLNNLGIDDPTDDQINTVFECVFTIQNLEQTKAVV
ncbi:MAG TPA: hypothetical protein PKD52_11045 [Clostridiales bacterium]|nr:hypothetical protein [Clostridiales bacterium]